MSLPIENDQILPQIYHFKRILHWGPVSALFIILIISAVTLHTLFYLAPPSESLGDFLAFASVCILLFLILQSFLRSMFVGPGFVPKGWQPCQGYKPPRSHHCRQCGRCVLKMDHHCPWINTCCGHANHGYFVHFLIFVPIGCALCMTFLIRQAYNIWYLLPFITNRDDFDYIFKRLFLILFTAGLAFGVTLSVGALCYCMLKTVLANQTNIETYILTKAVQWRQVTNGRPFIHPYDLGWWTNLRQVLTWKGHAVGNGFDWPLREGCGQFDLTLEQLFQKRLKYDSLQQAVVIKAFDGGFWCLCFSFGCLTCLRSPCCFGDRLRINVGDRVGITSCSGSRWLYGQLMESIDPEEKRINTEKPSDPPHGWFPRVCVATTTPRSSPQHPNNSSTTPNKRRSNDVHNGRTSKPGRFKSD